MKTNLSLVKYIQFIEYFLFRVVLKVLFRSSIKVPRTLELNKRPIIIVTNHISKIDACLLALLPFFLFKKIVPINFMTSEFYYNKWWISLFIKPSGAYRLKNWGRSLETYLVEATLSSPRI